MSLAKIARTSGYIIDPQEGGTESDVLRNKPKSVPVNLHGDTPLGLPLRHRPMKRASLAKEATSVTSEYGYGSLSSRQFESRRNGENKPQNKTPDQLRAEMAFFEGLTGKPHPKKILAKKKREREERDNGQANFSRESNSLGFGGFSGGARGLSGNPGGPGGGA